MYAQTHDGKDGRLLLLAGSCYLIARSRMVFRGGDDEHRATKEGQPSAESVAVDRSEREGAVLLHWFPQNSLTGNKTSNGPGEGGLEFHLLFGHGTTDYKGKDWENCFPNATRSCAQYEGVFRARNCRPARLCCSLS